MKPDKELKYKGAPSQIADFIENNLGIGKGKGKAKGNPLKDSDIQAAFPNIDPADYIDVMGEAYTEFMKRRVADGSAISDSPPPPPAPPVPQFTSVPLLDDKGQPAVDDKGNPIMVSVPVPLPAPASTPEQADPAVSDPSQTPDYVPPAVTPPESTPTTPTGGNS